jgi:thiamine-phosphate pyrophosphorylase
MYLGGLCLIADRSLCRLPLCQVVSSALDAGIRWVQYRDKTSSRREIFDNSKSLREMTARHNAVLIINDHADIAEAAGADGVHLGQEDLPLKEARRVMGQGKIIGISTHSLEEAVAASYAGADYIGFGPVFETNTKEAGRPKGLSMLTAVRRRVGVPVVAIGGINAGNGAGVFEAGADAVAVASALIQGDLAGNAGEFFKNVLPVK